MNNNNIKIEESKIKFQIVLEMVKSLIDIEDIPIEHKESLVDSIKFRRELSKESDRGSALLASTLMDSLLEKSLRNIFVGSKKHVDTLFSLNGPLGTFSGKVSICYSLGLISLDMMHDIHVIRHIRNVFGHSPSIISFEDDKIKKQCDSLRYTVIDGNESARSKFLNVVTGINGIISDELTNQKKIKEVVGIDLKKRKKEFQDSMIRLNNLAVSLLAQQEHVSE